MGFSITGEYIRKGEDFSSTFTNKDNGVIGFILADGMGSRVKAKETSEFIGKRTQCLLEEANCFQPEDLKDLFCKVHGELIQYAKDKEPDQLHGDSVSQYGSTLLVCLEWQKKLIVAYTGNGAIWHIRGNAFNSHENRILPWGIVNLLNPHTIPENGKEALYRYFSTETDTALVSPTVLEFSRDMMHGDYIFACTDGIYSNDHVSVGEVSSGIWIHMDRALIEFWDCLKDFVDTEKSEGEFQALVEKYKARLNGPSIVDDDASFGILYSSPSV